MLNPQTAADRIFDELNSPSATNLHHLTEPFYGVKNCLNDTFTSGGFKVPVISLNSNNPFVDGRQSERALQIRTGAERYFSQLNWVTLPEFTLATGRRADLIALSPTGDLCIVEVKSSVADLKADNKWPEYKDYCDQLIFATLVDVPAEIFPEDAGFMIADAYGAELLRPAPEHRLAAARRKKVHLGFARASAQRLERLCAHAGVESSSLVEDS